MEQIPGLVCTTAAAFKYSSNIGLELEDTNKVISNLKFIGMLQEGDKMNTKYGFVQPSGIATSLSRTFYYQDNKGNAHNFVKHTISRSIEIFLLHFHHNTPSDIAMCFNIITDLKKAMLGIKNMKTTYMHDTMYCCKLDTLLEELAASLVELEGKIPKTFVHNTRTPSDLTDSEDKMF